MFIIWLVLFVVFAAAAIIFQLRSMRNIMSGSALDDMLSNMPRSPRDPIRPATIRPATTNRSFFGSFFGTAAITGLLALASFACFVAMIISVIFSFKS